MSKPKPGTKGQHGGARNSAGRSSANLTERQCRDQVEAAQRNMASGRPYNRWITIAWEKGGADPRNAVKLTGLFVSEARDWLRAQDGSRLRWQWTQERGRVLGAHVHMLIYIPRHLDPLFKVMPLRWVKRLLPGPYVARTLVCKKLSTHQGEGIDPKLAEAIIMGKVRYMLKTGPAWLEHELGMAHYDGKPWGQRCTVFGKRAAIWQGWRQSGERAG